MPEPKTTPPADSSLTFEAALAQLDTIVHELEEGQIGLAEALARYEQGVKLLRQCYGMLESAERRIELLTGIDAAGNPVLEPFDAEASLDRQQRGKPGSRRRAAVESPEEGDIDAPGSLF